MRRAGTGGRISALLAVLLTLASCGAMSSSRRVMTLWMFPTFPDTQVGRAFFRPARGAAVLGEQQREGGDCVRRRPSAGPSHCSARSRSRPTRRVAYCCGRWRLRPWQTSLEEHSGRFLALGRPVIGIATATRHDQVVHRAGFGDIRERRELDEGTYHVEPADDLGGTALVERPSARARWPRSLRSSTRGASRSATPVDWSRCLGPPSLSMRGSSVGLILRLEVQAGVVPPSVRRSPERRMTRREGSSQRPVGLLSSRTIHVRPRCMSRRCSTRRHVMKRWTSGRRSMCCSTDLRRYNGPSASLSKSR